MHITEINEIVVKNTPTIVLVMGKNSLLGKFAAAGLKKVLKSLELMNVCFETLEINDEYFLDPLPTLMLYQNNQLKNSLAGFHNTNYYLSWIKENIK